MLSLMRILRTFSLLLALVAILALAAVTAFVVGVRSRNASVLRFARALQRDVVNPRVLVEAGRAGSQFSVIRHTGRTSGREYNTPVEAVPFEGGFFVALVYGEQAQWVRNVRAANRAVIIHDGTEHPIDDVRVVPIDETPLGRDNRTTIAIMGIRSAVRLSAAQPQATA
jgi:deazaflavin-dependent oxidoreductase (nitroreductase family)